jgi:hypothetical protein
MNPNTTEAIGLEPPPPELSAVQETPTRPEGPVASPKELAVRVTALLSKHTVVELAPTVTLAYLRLQYK